MSRFLKDNIFFMVGFIVFTAILYYLIYLFYVVPYRNEKAIFIWGDSQIYKGIDIAIVSQLTHKKVYSAAHHGAGIYPFLFFANHVPANSEVILSISELAQIRRKERDFNVCGLSFWSIQNLSKNNYSFEEIFPIITQNLKPHKNITDEIDLRPCKDSMVITADLSEFKDYYQEVPTFLEKKQDLFRLGIERLISKNCKFTFIKFPSHPELTEIGDNSPIKPMLEQFQANLISYFDDMMIDSIKIDRSRNIFSDYSHLNCNGAKDLTSKLAKKINNQQKPTFYIAY